MELEERFNIQSQSKQNNIQSRGDATAREEVLVEDASEEDGDQTREGQKSHENSNDQLEGASKDGDQRNRVGEATFNAEVLGNQVQEGEKTNKWADIVRGENITLITTKKQAIEFDRRLNAEFELERRTERETMKGGDGLASHSDSSGSELEKELVEGDGG